LYSSNSSPSSATNSSSSIVSTATS
jgi:hypothetical protein